METVKIGLDARWAVGEYRGMGRFTRFFVKPIEKKVVAFAYKGQTDDTLNVVGKGINFYPFWEQFMLPYLCKQYNINIQICPYNTAPIWGNSKTKLILIVHDIIFMKSFSDLPKSNSTYQNLGRIYRRLILPLVINKATYLITVSDYSKSEIIKTFNIDERKIVVIPNTLNEEWFQYQIIPLEDRKSYIFCISGEGPSKNLLNGIKGYINLVQSDNSIVHNLIIAGVKPQEKDKYNKLIHDEGVENRIIFLDFISNELLINYYQNACLFFFPSLIEGFGIPLIEAMVLGTPIACSNTSSFPEVTGDAALQFNPKDILSISNALNLLIKDNNLCKTLQKKGFMQVKKYHPDKFKEQVEEFWKTINT